MRVRYRLASLYHATNIFCRDLWSDSGLSFKHTLRAWRNGQTRREYRLVGLEQGGDPKDYINLWQKLRQIEINRHHRYMLSSKLSISCLLAAHGIPHATALGMIHHGMLHFPSSSSPVSLKEFIFDHIDDGQGVVIKPDRSHSGRGVLLLRRQGEKFTLDGENLSAQEIVLRLSGIYDHLVCELIEQGEYGAKSLSELHQYHPSANAVGPG